MLFLRILFLMVGLAKYAECSGRVHGRESELHIDLDVIASNYRELINKLPQRFPVMAVVKGNAYGIGAVAVSNTVLELGADYLGVAFIDEGVHLRKQEISAPILVLGYTAAYGQGIELAIRYNLTINVFSLQVLNAVQQEAIKWNSNPVNIHIKVNTGLNRLGLEPDELVPFVNHIKNGNYSKIIVEGVFSHFATLGEVPLTPFAVEYAKKQLWTFKRVVNEARKVLHIPLAHIANSDAVHFFKEEAFLDMVRPGIAILGFTPYGKPAMSLTSIVSAIRKPLAGQVLGYKQNTTVNGHQWIATIPLGYADGMRTDCSHRVGYVLVKGKRVPIVSGIMMDQMLVDVTRVYPVKVGDEVVVFGKQRGAEINVDEYVKRCGGSDLSLTTQLNKRLPRAYSREGKIVYFENNLLSY